MRLHSLALVASLSVLVAAPIACSGGDLRPPPKDDGAGDGGGGVVDSGRIIEAAVDTGPPDSGDSGIVQQGDPANIEHTTTICGAIACGIMGIRTSGFQELADVSFLVKDSEGIPVTGVPVTFELESPPTGTEFLGSGADGGATGSQTVIIKTDLKGIATARVQSGVTLGVFTVKATVSPTLSAKSPAIGVRGVTPANRGFNIQCGARNLAAYADPVLPKALKTSCTVTLIDRFNNPVGKATTVNLKVEAGAIASSIQSTAFSSTGTNTEEGKAVVEFNTVGTFPPVDVPTSGVLATGTEAFNGTVNQRDGLVTILAYAAGEEAFDDNNSNGLRDGTENFIDQGEPFVDSNDNNMWDPGEFYADVAPKNNQYDPPNGAWDKQTTIWTTTHILYSGWLTKADIVTDPETVPINTIKQMKAYFSDDRFNIPQAGAVTSFSFSRLGTRGGATAAFESILDGYGFGLTRALYSATDNTVGCNAVLPRCVWLTKFTFGYPLILGTTVTLTGATAAGTPETQTFTFGATVHSAKYDHFASATFQ